MRATGWELRCIDDYHYKYYRFVVAGSFTVFQYGRIGEIQSLTPTDHGSTLDAQDAAWKQSTAKLRKGYEVAVDEFAFDVDPDWLAHCRSTSRPESRALRQAFTAAAGGPPLRGQLAAADGPRVVALRRWRAQSAALAAAAPRAAAVLTAGAPHPRFDVRLAVLDPAGLAELDAHCTPRASLIDLGPAEDGDTSDVLATTLAIFDPSAGPDADLAAALRNARLVHA